MQTEHCSQEFSQLCCNARREPEDAAWCLRWPSREVWCRNLPHAGWCEARDENREHVGNMRDRDRVFSATCIGVVWQLRQEQWKQLRPVVLVAEADEGVALVIVMHAVPRVDRRIYAMDISTSVAGMHNAKVSHDDRCRDRIWRKMTIRYKVSESLHEQSQKTKFSLIGVHFDSGLSCNLTQERDMFFLLKKNQKLTSQQKRNNTRGEHKRM